MIGNILSRKPGNEPEALATEAKSGLQALDTLLQDRNNLAKEVISLRQIIDKMTLENEHLRTQYVDMQLQRDFWMRVHAKLEANLNQLGSIMQTMYGEFKAASRVQLVNPDAKQIAERFSPEATKNAKSVG